MHRIFHRKQCCLVRATRRDLNPGPSGTPRIGANTPYMSLGHRHVIAVTSVGTCMIRQSVCELSPCCMMHGLWRFSRSVWRTDDAPVSEPEVEY
jgi:hypothetical protein